MPRSRFGSIQRLGTDHYRVFWMDGTTKRSKRIRGTREEAEAYLASQQLSHKLVSDMEWSRYWSAAIEPSFEGLAEKTVAEYRRLWARELEPRIGRAMVGDTTWRQVERVLGMVESPSVQQAAMRLWRKMCSFAVRDGLIDRNPVDRSIRLKPRKKRAKTLLVAEDVGPWLEALSETKYAPVFAMEVGGGLRHEEACAMVWENVEELEAYGQRYAVVKVERGLVTVGGRKVLKSTKNEHSVREVVIGEPFASVILGCHGGTGPVCGRGSEPYTKDSFTSPATVTHNWRNWCERNDVQYIRPGDMRSVFATLHGEAGTPDSLVSLAMGHSDGTTKGKHYQQRTRRGLMVAADSLTEFLAEE